MVRGGWRQRLGRAAQVGGGTKFANPLAQDAGSHLAATLLALMAWGELSAPTLQRIAGAAVKDGIDNPIVQRMARSGSSGVYRGNCYRDIMQLFPDMVLSAGMAVTKVPMRFTRGAIEVYEQAVLFSSLFGVFVKSANVARHLFHFPLASNNTMCHLPFVTCHTPRYRMSYVGCRMSYVVCRVCHQARVNSYARCHVWLYNRAHVSGERVAR